MSNEPDNTAHEATATQMGAPRFPTGGPVPDIPRFEVLEALGHGGMGIVYRARDRQLGRAVALKTLANRDNLPPSARERFERETKAIAQLQHPHIGQLYEAGEVDSVPWFAMELLPGGSLDEQLRKGPLAPDRAARLIECLARAIAHCHAQGILHRDLKPGNVLFSADGTPKITDFGIAKHLTDVGGSTKTGDILGTPSYMAPEQATGVVKELGPPCDVYALGAILYHCLTGVPPFRGSDPMQILMMVLAQDPVAPQRIQAGLPKDLEIICLKCLEKRPRQRYATADELADDLSRFLRHEPILARPLGWLGRGIKWAQRRPTAATTIGLLSLAASLLLAGGLWYNARLRDELDRTQSLSRAGRVLADWLLFEHAQALNATATTTTKEALVDKLLAYFQTLDEAAHDAKNYDLERAAAYERLAEVLGDPGFNNLGRIEEAVVNYKRAQAIRERLATSSPPGSAARIQLLENRRRLAMTEGQLLGDATTIQALQSVVNDVERLLKNYPDNGSAIVLALQTHGNLGELLLGLGQLPLALDHANKCLAFANRIQDFPEWKNQDREGRGHAHLLLGKILLQVPDYPRAVAELETALDIERTIAQETGAGLSRAPILSQVLIAYGDALWEVERFPAACEAFEEAEQLRRQALQRDPRSQSRVAALLVAMDRMGYVHAHRGNPQAAIATYREMAELSGQLAASHPRQLELRRNHIIALTGLAEALANNHQWPEAEVEARRAVQATEQAWGQSPKLSHDWKLIGDAHKLLADVLWDASQRDSTPDSQARQSWITDAIQHWEQAHAAFSNYAKSPGINDEPASWLREIESLMRKAKEGAE